MQKLIIIIFFSIICLNQSYATTLIQALSKAYKDNSKLNAERENLEISKEEINEAKSDFLPSVTISGYVSNENTTKLTNRSGADVQSTDVEPSQESILIEQTLFQGLGGVANLKKSNIGLELSKSRLKKAEQEILFEAIEAYTNLIINKKKVGINILNVNLIERQVENDKNRLERSEINLTDLAQSEASLAGANAKLIETQNQLITSKLNYEKTIGIINNYEDLRETYVFNYELPRSLASANQIAKKENPDLNIAILELKLSQQDVLIAQSELSPSASLSYKITRTDDTSSSYDETDKEILKAEASWPIFSGGKNIASLKKSKSFRQQKQLLLEDSKKSNKALVANAWSNFQSSKSFLTAIRSQVNAAEIANEGITIEYESGSGRSTLDVIQSNSILLNAKINLVNSKRDFFLSQFKLLASIGRLTGSYLGLN
jgi:outer membrane protein